MVFDLVKLLLSILFYASVVILTFSLFQKTIRDNHIKISFIALVLGVINNYVRYIMETPLYPIHTTVALIVLLTIIYRYPVFYSLIMSTIALFSYVFMETLIFYPLIYFEFVTLEHLANSLPHYVLSHLLIIFVMLLISFLFIRFKIGFSFIIRRFRRKELLKSHNFLWCAISVVFVGVLQFFLLDFEEARRDVLVFFFISLIFLVAIFYAYKENKKALYARYKVFENMKPRKPDQHI